MATPRKLPSGRWNVQVYSHTDSSGKKIYKSITADTKKECSLLAAQFYARRDRIEKGNPTVNEAISYYISSKKDILSPTTIRAYQSIANTEFEEIGNIRIYALNDRVLQKWVNNISRKLSPKSVSNVWGLLSSVLNSFGLSFRTRLPQRKIYDAYIPSDSEVKALIARLRASGDHDTANAVMLAAYGTLRRSEVCGLRQCDIDRKTNTIHVHTVEVVTSTRDVVLKEVPKTSASDRFIPMPAKMVSVIPDSEKPIALTPDLLSRRFKAAAKDIGLPQLRFHDLRHYAASFMHAIGIPDAYIMERGGWETDSTLKRIYRGTMNEYKAKYTSALFDHFDAF